ncbi:WXG100 family type VII secretion target [Streptomyces sp. ODS28]|uniref:WXG100 family type VII secretion target n=1 Tax=Streptomyces sp. ODS28 TaxID=3136688 RepID=UPI0031EB9D92
MGKYNKGDIAIDYQEMKTVADKMRKDKESIDNKLAKMKQFIDQLLSEGFVTQHSSKKFHEDFEDFKQGMSKTNDALDDLSKSLDQSVERFQQADKPGKG